MKKKTNPAITRTFSLKHHRLRITSSNKICSDRFMEISYTSFY